MRSHSIVRLLLTVALTTGCLNDPGAPMGMLMDDDELGVTSSSLTAAERRVRAGQIRDAACGAGMTQGWMLAGIADAETRMSHCWSELTWACQGPSSSDCGGGPTVAGAGDGPCSLRQGGIGMFQFDAGTFDDTLRREGDRILSIAGNTQAAVDFVAAMVQRSAYTPSLPTRESAIEWMNGVRVGNDRWDAWVRTVTHYYNGCAPSYSCFPQRYAHYRDNTSGVWNEMGADFWSCCRPGAEVCNGADDDCDGAADEDEVCEVARLHDQPAAYAPPRTTDVNADGRADVCARGGGGVRCWPASATGWDAEWTTIPWSDANGWGDVSYYATLRMGDVNGDGRADVCARSSTDFHCALSIGDGFAEATVWRAGLSNENAWNLPRYYTTIRLADVNADGKDDLCARDSQGFGCWISDGARFEQRIEGPRWSDAAGFTAARYYGTLRMGDVDGDRRADVCIRGTAGVDCVLSDGVGFTRSIGGPEWSDALGWGGLGYWSTMRLADVNGDDLDDLCARSSTDLRCVLSAGDAFGETVIVGALSDANGWDDVTNYATLRVGDIDGDGAEDLCLRGNDLVGCWAWDGTAFVQRDGPAWSDANGWSASRYYETMRLADIDGDGRDDLCARSSAGWFCHRSTDTGFGEAIAHPDLGDAVGWTEHRYWSTIMSAGRACVAGAEVCNGRDDDCDGEIDEGTELCNGVDDDCDEQIDEGLMCTTTSDGGVVGPVRDGGVAGPGGELASGCTCAAAGAGGRSMPMGLSLIVLAFVLRRRARTTRAGLHRAAGGNRHGIHSSRGPHPRTARDRVGRAA